MIGQNRISGAVHDQDGSRAARWLALVLFRHSGHNECQGCEQLVALLSEPLGTIAAVGRTGSVDAAFVDGTTRCNPCQQRVHKAKVIRRRICLAIRTAVIPATMAVRTLLTARRGPKLVMNLNSPGGTPSPPIGCLATFFLPDCRRYSRKSVYTLTSAAAAA